MTADSTPPRILSLLRSDREPTTRNSLLVPRPSYRSPISDISARKYRINCLVMSAGGWKIARAIATRPGYLLLDEPLMKVEPAKLDALLTLIQLASQRGIGVLVAHQLNQYARRIRDVSDRAYLISGGQILGTLGG